MAMAKNRSKKKKTLKVALNPPFKKKTNYPVVPGKVGYYECHPYFSFRYYHGDSLDFSFDNLQDREFKIMFRRLQEMSQKTWKTIFNEDKRFYHAHRVDWTKTSFKNGFKHLHSRLRELPVFQFEIFEECRMLGFFNAHNVFKIVWVDRLHKVYPRK